MQHFSRENISIHAPSPSMSCLGFHCIMVVAWSHTWQSRQSSSVVFMTTSFCWLLLLRFSSHSLTHSPRSDYQASSKKNLLRPSLDRSFLGFERSRKERRSEQQEGRIEESPTRHNTGLPGIIRAGNDVMSRRAAENDQPRYKWSSRDNTVLRAIPSSNRGSLLMTLSRLCLPHSTSNRTF